MPVSKNRRKNGKIKKYNPQKTHKQVLNSAVTQMIQARKTVEEESTAIIESGNVTIRPPSLGVGTGVQNEDM